MILIEIKYSLLEFILKRLVIQEHIVISKLFVKSILHLFHASYNASEISVSG